MKELFIVGIGPGCYEQLTIQAADILNKCTIIIGYTVYIDLIKDHFKDKIFISTPMTKETDRCILALQKASEGTSAALICSGDAGVYGLAGLTLSLKENYPGVTVTIIPGVTAALSGAALLGAPLIHDFAVISLSDLMTPLKDILKRIRLAAEGDYVISLYNPSSKKRADYLQKACDCILEYQKPDTICGIVKNIGRENEYIQILTLQELRNTAVDMFTTVFIGNSHTVKKDNKMITPRGYKLDSKG